MDTTVSDYPGRLPIIMYTIPSIPQEITESIIDDVHLKSDITTLKSCSLVCRAWIPRSRFHLFSKMRIILSRTNGDALQHFAAFLTSSTAACTALPLGFPPAIDYIRELRISDPFRSNISNPSAIRPQQDPEEIYYIPDSLPEHTMSDLEFILAALPCLQALNLDISLGVGKGLSGAIKPISLDRLTINVDSDLSVMLRLFSSIRTLHLIAPMNEMPLPQSMPSIDTRSPLHVGNLVIGTRVLRKCYAEALMIMSSMIAVESVVKIESEVQKDWSVFGVMMSSGGFTNSKHLMINLQAYELSGLVPNFACVSLEPLHSLTSIVLNGFGVTIPPRISHSPIPSPRLTKPPFNLLSTTINTWFPPPSTLSSLAVEILFRGPSGRLEPTDVIDFLRYAVNDADWARIEEGLMLWNGLQTILFNCYYLASLSPPGAMKVDDVKMRMKMQEIFDEKLFRLRCRCAVQVEFKPVR